MKRPAEETGPDAFQELPEARISEWIGRIGQ